MYFNLEESDIENPTKSSSVRHEEKDLPKETLHTPKILFFVWPVVTGVSQKVISLHLKVK